MNLSYLNLEEILRLHFQVIEDFGGSHSVRNEGRLKSVVEAPRQDVFGKQQSKSIFEKAAVYLRNIIGDHPFTDGNKRTAITVCGIFLSRNGINITAGARDLEDFAKKVSTEHTAITTIAGWLASDSN